MVLTSVSSGDGSSSALTLVNSSVVLVAVLAIASGSSVVTTVFRVFVSVTAFVYSVVRFVVRTVRSVYMGLLRLGVIPLRLGGSAGVGSSVATAAVAASVH